MDAEIQKLRDLIEDAPPEIRGPLQRAEGLVTDLNKASGTIGEAASLSSRSGTSPPTPVQLWRHASVVYDLLRTAWVCQCRSEHCVDLLLPLVKPPAAVFSVIFRFSTSSESSFEPLWSYRAVDIVERPVSLLDRPLTLSPVTEDAPSDAFSKSAKLPA